MNRGRLSRKELEALLDKFGSVGKVASYTSIPYSTIYAWYKKYGIGLQKSCMTIYEELRSVEISDVHKSVVVGSILGDGSLIKQRRSKNARLQIGHCTKQLGYLKWKKSLLSPFSTKIILAEKPGPKVIKGKRSRSSGYYLFNTIAHPNITEYYNKYYPKGKKTVHESVISDLTLLALAIWLADDGSFSLRKECKYSIRGSIATCSFSVEEIEILICALRKFYDGSAKIDIYNNTISLTGTDAIEKLLNMITYILPKTIHYKFVPQRLMRKAPYKI